MRIFTISYCRQQDRGSLPPIMIALDTFSMVVYQTAGMKAGGLKTLECMVKQAAILQDPVAA